MIHNAYAYRVTDVSLLLESGILDFIDTFFKETEYLRKAGDSMKIPNASYENSNLEIPLRVFIQVDSIYKKILEECPECVKAASEIYYSKIQKERFEFVLFDLLMYHMLDSLVERGLLSELYIGLIESKIERFPHVLKKFEELCYHNKDIAY